MYKYLKKIKEIVLIFLRTTGVYYLLCFWVPILFIKIIPIITSAFNVNYTMPILIQVRLQILLWGIGSLLTIMWYLHRSNIKMRNLINRLLKPLPKFSTIVLLVLLGFTLNCVIGLLGEIISPIFPNSMQNYSNRFSYYTISTTFFVMTVIIGPIMEEFMFRYVMVDRLKCVLSSSSRIIFVQAVLFGIFHFNLAQGIAAFFAGIVYMLVVLWTESILSGIVVHASYNAIWVASTYLGDFLFLEKYNYGISITKLSNFGYILMSMFFSGLSLRSLFIFI